jgi:hypothetical protein
MWKDITILVLPPYSGWYPTASLHGSSPDDHNLNGEIVSIYFELSEVFDIIFFYISSNL